jgi:hypothetical protein
MDSNSDFILENTHGFNKKSVSTEDRHNKTRNSPEKLYYYNNKLMTISEIKETHGH